MSFEVNRLGNRFAAEVVGIDLARPLSADEFAAVRDAWFDAGVIVFRDQHLSPAQHVAFSRRFGELIVHVMHRFLLPGHPEILLLSNKKHADGTPMGFEDAGRYWHSDISYDEYPAMGSQLYAVEIPPSGGDTLFADMRHALRTLPAGLRRRIDNRRARHSYTRNYRKNETVEGGRPAIGAEQQARLRDVCHPMVRKLEYTGDEALFVNPGFTFAVEDMDEAESDELLAALFEHSTQEAFIHTHEWRPRDLLCWDNRTAMHRATMYEPGHTRHMHRTTIAGGRPV